jgi:hypothetical protein
MSCIFHHTKTTTDADRMQMASWFCYARINVRLNRFICMCVEVKKGGNYAWSIAR